MNNFDPRLLDPVFYKELTRRCLSDFENRMSVKYPNGRDELGRYFYFDKDSLMIDLCSVDMNRALNDSSYVPNYTDPSSVLSKYHIEDAQGLDVSINSFESKTGFIIIRPIDCEMVTIKENQSHDKYINRDIRMGIVYKNSNKIVLYHKDSVTSFVGPYSLIHESKIIGSLDK